MDGAHVDTSVELTNDQSLLKNNCTTSTESHDEEVSPHSQSDLLLAATLINDAKNGRNVEFKTDPESVRMYLFFSHWLYTTILYFCVGITLSLALFEEPFAISPNASAPYWATMIPEVLCLIFFACRFIHNYRIDPKVNFWKDAKHIIIVIIISLTVLDIFVFLVWSLAFPGTGAVRWSRPLRAFYVVNIAEGRQIRRAIRNIRRTVPEILNVLILFFFTIIMFGLLAVTLFRKKNLKYIFADTMDGDGYFQNFFDACWDLYVLVSTANNPDVMMPAYDKSNWYSIFFVLYMFVADYIFMSILLAVTYTKYKGNLKNEVQNVVYIRRKKLKLAFDILKRKHNGIESVSVNAWYAVLSILKPKYSREHVDLLWQVLDEGTEGRIGQKKFLEVSDLLNVDIMEVKDTTTFLAQNLPRIFHSPVSNKLRLVVKHKGFRYFFDVMIVLNAIMIGLQSSEVFGKIEEAEWFFLGIFTLEILLKLYTFGPVRFCHSKWNIFDVLIIGGAVIASSIEAALDEYALEEGTLDILFVLRVLRLVKIVGSFNRFKIIVQTVLNIGPSIVSYGGVIFVVYYFFAIIGMEAFGNKIYYLGYDSNDPLILSCNNTKLINSTFAADRYCSNNFNNILSAFIVLFELMVVNQWHVISSGFTRITHKAARLYFLSFHVTCVLIVLNIFVAFIIEAFILEYSFSKARLQGAVEEKIKQMGLSVFDHAGTRRQTVGGEQEPAADQANRALSRLRTDSLESIPPFPEGAVVRFAPKKQSRKKVDVLLQRMFEDEINTDDLGFDEETSMQDSVSINPDFV